MKKTILLHLLSWILLSIAYFFVSEPIACLLFPDTHEVEHWLAILFLGLATIFIMTILSLIVSIIRHYKKGNRKE